MSLRRVATFVLIAAAIVIGTGLRFDGLGAPSYWLDEILGQQLTIEARAQPWWHWLTGLEAEHGPLYYATQLTGGEFTGRLMAVLFGVAAVALLGLVRDSHAPIAALLLAVAPLHVYYSREARPYALLILLTTLLIVALLRDAGDVPLIAVLLALLYTSAVAAPVVAAAAVAAFCIGRKRLALIAALGAGAFLLLYRGTPRSTPDVAFPPDLFGTISRALTVSAFATDERGRTVAVMLVLALIGAIALWRRDRRSAVIVIAMTMLPIAFAVLSLIVFKHWFAVRYVAPAIAGFVLLVAAGIVAVSTVARAAREMLALLIVIVIARESLPAARTEPFRKLDWRAIAATLRENAKPGDVVLAAEEWSEVSLRYYLGNDVRIIGASRVELAEMLIDRRQGTWIMSAGYSGDGSVRSWMCRYPLVMSSVLEGFRLHYIGTQRDLLQRATPSTLRAAASSFRTIQPDDDVLFGDGWAQSEGRFRWANATRATVFVPRFGKRDGVIRATILPLPPQSMRVSLNGHDLGTIRLAHEWREYSIAAPASAWIDGLNTITFAFDHATEPSERDRRTLAACFESIGADDSREVRRAMLPSLRIDANRFLDAGSVWRNTRTRFPAAQLNRPRVEKLLGRLGFDPVAAWPKLASGAVYLDDAVETIAYGSDCESDRAFLDRAFAILLERAPNDAEARDLLARLANGSSREVIVGRIVKSNDFRALALSFASR
jgi:hypothetical protein